MAKIGEESALAITNVSVIPVRGTPEAPITQGIPNTVEVTVRNTGGDPITAGTRVPVGLFALDAHGRVLQAHAFEATLPALAPAAQTTITSPTTHPLTLLSTDTTALHLLTTGEIFRTAHTTPIVLDPAAAPDLSCFFEITSLATGGLCVACALIPACTVASAVCLVATGVEVLEILDKTLNQGLIADISEAIQRRDFLETGQTALDLLNDTIVIALDRAGGDVLAFLFDSAGTAVDGINGKSCIVNITKDQAKAWATGFFSQLVIKAAAAGEKVLSMHVASPADLFVTDSAAQTTSITGTGAAMQGIARSQALLLQTEPPIKIVNILGASGQYRITLRGTGEGDTALTIFHPQSSSDVVQVTYTNLPTTASSEAILTLDEATQEYTLLLDTDGDRTADQQISPDAIVPLSIGCTSDGDANADGTITPADALRAFQQFLGIAESPLDACQQTRADVTRDGRITPADALCIFQKFLGLPSCLG